MSIIDEVKQKTDITEIIGQYVTLKKSGRNLCAPCPFHSEKHPSFFVYPDQQSWHCFGACNTGGDVFSFLMKKEGYDFGEALRVLAERAGVELPSYTTRSSQEKEAEDAVFRANEAAAVYFHNNLLNSPAAEKARAYVEKRGYTKQTVSDFGLGYSLNEWETLKHYLVEKGFTEAELVNAGLLYQNEDGHTTDRFRGKLMIPIRDQRGRVTGFGARVLDDSLPKYVNSPQTPVFDKSSTLFAIDRAAPNIRRQDGAIVMEGYMDVITAHQNGINNAVAAMGTAITEMQVSILKKMSRNLVLAMDADEAGEEAMIRTAGQENVLGGEIRVVALPEGKDPDDVIRGNPEEWQKLAGGAVPLLDFLFSRTTAGLDLTTARDKSLAAESLLPVIAGMTDPVRQSHYLQKLAGMVSVDLNTMKAMLSRRTVPAHRNSRTPKQAAVPASGTIASTAREDYVLAMLLHYPHLVENATMPDPELFVSSENREVFAAILAAGNQPNPENIETIRNTIDPILQDRMEMIAKTVLPETRTAVEQKFIDCVNRLKRHYVKTLAARKAASSGDGDGDARLEEDVMFSSQLRELDAQGNRKAKSPRR